MKIEYIRRTTQIIFFILIIYGGFLTMQIFGVEKPVLTRGTEGEINLVDAALPFRSCRYIEPKPTLFESCSMKYLLNVPLHQTPWFSLSIYLLVILGLCFIFGRFMCGWFCPLGLISDILIFIRRKLGINYIRLPKKLRDFLRLWRYSFFLFLVFLGFTLIAPFAYGIFMNKNYFDVACQICPARTILPIVGGRLPIMPPLMTIATSIFSIISFVFLGIFMTGLIITRLWCRICPNGTFTSMFNIGALISKNKDVQKCTRCGICKRVCPFENDHVFDEKKKDKINHPNCIMCFNCVQNCPEKDCLTVKFLGKTIVRSNFKVK